MSRSSDARRAVARTAIAAALGLLLAGCGAGDGGSGAASRGDGVREAVRRGGTAAVGVPAGATTVLPPLAAAALDFEIGGQLFLGLNYATWEDDGLRYEPGHPMGLARSWRIDGATLVYALETARRWSDGRPVRAADVVFTYGLLRDTALALPLSSTAERLDSVVARNDSTVAFHFDRAYPGMLFDTGVGILPSHVYGDLPRESFRGGMPGLEPGRPQAFVASGPLTLSGWEPGDRIELARNPASSPEPLLDRVVIRVLPDAGSRAAALRAGELDLALLDSFRRAARLDEEPELGVGRIPQRGYDYIAWNPGSHPAFSDVRVRRALSLAIDRSAILRALDMQRFAEPAWGPYGSLFDALRAPPPHEPLYDPDGARRLLDTAGWRDADGDGVREREGRDLAFDLRVPVGNERREAAAQIIERQLAAVGARVALRREEFNALFGRAMAREYEAVLLGWQVGLDPDISPFWSEPRSPLNVVGFEDPVVRAAIDSARSRPTAAAAAPYWRRAAARVAAAYPYAFLWFFDLPVAVRSRLRGVDLEVTGWGQGMHRWWLDPGAEEGSGAAGAAGAGGSGDGPAEEPADGGA